MRLTQNCSRLKTNSNSRRKKRFATSRCRLSSASETMSVISNRNSRTRNALSFPATKESAELSRRASRSGLNSKSKSIKTNKARCLTRRRLTSSDLRLKRGGSSQSSTKSSIRCAETSKESLSSNARICKSNSTESWLSLRGPRNVNTSRG